MVHNKKYNVFLLNKFATKAFIVICAFFCYMFVGSVYLNSYTNSRAVTLFFALMLSVCLVILFCEKLIYSYNTLIFSVIMLFLSIVFRVSNFALISGDYSEWLFKWIMNFSAIGLEGIANNTTNYNYPYLYLLWFLGEFIPSGHLFAVKFFSVIFDVVLAFGVLKIVSIFTQEKAIKLISFLTVLLLPTVILNGAWWAQCDSVFTAFGVLALYFVLKDKPWLAAVCAGASLAFKVQAIFILPIIIVLLIIRKIRLIHGIAFFGAYIAFMLPALLAGAPLSSLVTTYIGTAGTYSDLNRNSASIYTFLPYEPWSGVSSEVASGMSQTTIHILEFTGIAAAIMLILVIYFITFKNKEKITNYAVLIIMFIMSAGIPFLLPHMHDRYFFVAEIFGLCLAMAGVKRNKLLLVIPLLMQFAVYTPYNTFLGLGLPKLPLELSTVCVFIAIIIAFKELYNIIKTVD